MKNPLTWLIVACIVIGLLIACSIWMGYERYTYKKSADDYRLKYEACMSAPYTVDTVHDSIVVHDTTWIKLKPIHTVIHDTLVKYCSNYFEDTFKFVNTEGVGRIHYALEIKDCTAMIKFKDIVSPTRIIKTTVKVDTCINKPPAYKAKLFHYGVYTDLSINNFKQFPGIGLGGQLIIKDQVTIGAGALYLDKFYGNVRIGVLFK